MAASTFDVHTLVVASVALQFGLQSVIFAVLTTTYAIKQGFRPSSRADRPFLQLFTLERGLTAGIIAIVLGDGHLWAFMAWYRTGFGPLDYASTMRVVVPGATLVTAGGSLMLNSFLCSMLGLDRR